MSLYPIRLNLAREVLSGNALAYSHWRKRTKDRDDWISRLKVAIRHIEMATGSTAWWANAPRKVTITSYRHGVLDDDNLSAGCKHLRDALVRCHLLKDDTKEWATFTYVQHRVPRKQALNTYVEIDEATVVGEAGEKP